MATSQYGFCQFLRGVVLDNTRPGRSGFSPIRSGLELIQRDYVVMFIGDGIVMSAVWNGMDYGMDLWNCMEWNGMLALIWQGTQNRYLQEYSAVSFMCKSQTFKIQFKIFNTCYCLSSKI
ncbi:hypothetical protein BpHYR1_028187 [Brachionus plicatilis]|uniref:Uncharacterized protein n=1 Tax=Brachionus plicatilis TaxID=10195 RepID=A0A3M7SNL9_BRAPC|nr:hypothetical protein BpHYR1_028187 [Brachionus plicatilis]